MRILALSDIHVDYEINAKWIAGLSKADYTHDVLLLAGDVTDSLKLFSWCLTTLAVRFRRVFFVPGNHDLWVLRDRHVKDSVRKFEELGRVVESSGASTHAYHGNGLSIIPLLGWYDYSFGEPGDQLRSVWMDYRACHWPDGFREREVAEYFESLNLDLSVPGGHRAITFSHFLPRIDVMPALIPPSKRYLYPILGTTRLERQLRLVSPMIHVYGHSHVNRRKTIDGVTYINNAFGYPAESNIAARQLLCIHEV